MTHSGEFHTRTMRVELKGLRQVYGPSYGLTNAFEELDLMSERYAAAIDSTHELAEKKRHLQDELADADERIKTLSFTANEQAHRLNQRLKDVKKLSDEGWQEVGRLEQLIYKYAEQINEAKGPVRTITKDFLENAMEILD